MLGGMTVVFRKTSVSSVRLVCPKVGLTRFCVDEFSLELGRIHIGGLIKPSRRSIFLPMFYFTIILYIHGIIYVLKLILIIRLTSVLSKNLKYLTLNLFKLLYKTFKYLSQCVVNRRWVK